MPIRQNFPPSKFFAIQYIILKFLNLALLHLLASLPASLPAIRPGSTSAMAPGFSHKKGNHI